MDFSSMWNVFLLPPKLLPIPLLLLLRLQQRRTPAKIITFVSQSFYNRNTDLVYRFLSVFSCERRLNTKPRILSDSVIFLHLRLFPILLLLLLMLRQRIFTRTPFEIIIFVP